MTFELKKDLKVEDFTVGNILIKRPLDFTKPPRVYRITKEYPQEVIVNRVGIKYIYHRLLHPTDLPVYRREIMKITDEVKGSYILNKSQARCRCELYDPNQCYSVNVFTFDADPVVEPDVYQRQVNYVTPMPEDKDDYYDPDVLWMRRYDSSYVYVEETSMQIGDFEGRIGDIIVEDGRTFWRIKSVTNKEHGRVDLDQLKVEYAYVESAYYQLKNGAPKWKRKANVILDQVVRSDSIDNDDLNPSDGRECYYKQYDPTKSYLSGITNDDYEYIG